MAPNSKKTAIAPSRMGVMAILINVGSEINGRKATFGYSKIMIENDPIIKLPMRRTLSGHKKASFGAFWPKDSDTNVMAV